MAALIRRLPKCDIIVVRIDPIIRALTSHAPPRIHDRITELSFNSTFWLEMSVSGLLLTLVEEGECHSACKFDPLSRGIGVQN
jgi:hypothetical protein